MRAVSILMLGAVLAASPALARQQPDDPPEVVASRQAAQKFGATLKEALQQAIQSGGPVNGIAVCHDQAGQIATDLGQKEVILIGRTSLKLRNPANAPDNWELAVLKQFEARKTQGEPADKLEFFAVIDDDQGQKTFRYMKALPMGGVCSNCHGPVLKPDVIKKLEEYYPKDKARGFQVGDLRGAFTISQPM